LSASKDIKLKIMFSKNHPQLTTLSDSLYRRRG